MPSLPSNDFRGRRDYLPDEAFGLHQKGEDPPLDRIGETAWRALMASPDDVVLRTTSFNGDIAEHCFHVWAAVIDSFPQGRERESPAFEALLDLADHVYSASFAALHGFYRQAFSTLRSALELMIVTARLAQEGLDAVRAWRYDDSLIAVIRPVSYLDELADSKAVQRLNEAMDLTVFARSGARGAEQRSGWVWDTYQRLSKFTHVTPGYTDAELWEGSTGPIWVRDSFVTFIALMREVVAIAAIFARIADPGLQLGDDWIALLTSTDGENWVPGLRQALQSLGVDRQ